jgi:hypothetical protein
MYDVQPVGRDSTMPAAYAKPDGQKVNRVPRKHDWVDLPPAPEVPVPPLPEWRMWHPNTATWWATLWAKPQAVMWEPDGSTLWTLAMIYDDVIAGRVETGKVSNEIRQHEDRHGLNPKAMLQLLWRFADDEEPAGHKTASKGRRNLKVV